MELEIDPLDGMADRPPVVRVRAASHVGVKLELRITDAAGHAWTSLNTYGADVSGLVDLGTHEPLTGTYQGIDPAGPWWSMRFAAPGRAPVDFSAAPDSLTCRVTAQAGAETAVATVVRRWAAAGVERQDHDVPGSTISVFTPAGSGRGPGVLIVPGFTGGAAMLPRAALLASRGYVAVVVDYLSDERTQPGFTEVPIETITDALGWLAAHPRVDADRIGVFASSAGCVGALAALAYLDHHPIRAIALVSPSSVVWQAAAAGGPPARTSSWTHRGRPLPWVRVRAGRLLPELLGQAVRHRVARHPRPTALHLRSSYAAGLRNLAEVDRATIPVERIDAPLLLLCGEDDQLWPADQMARAMVARRGVHGIAHQDETRTFPDAGHFLRPPLVPTTAAWSETLMAGGSAEGIALAQQESWDATLSFLARRLA
ncbi:acyl-CoA thioesterase/bile acid-CoA:amino acid N-acyltransferase family protein [Actinoalloteichus fjordicus]|uniref:Acyl-CoA thioester hydrolase/bile acid-CoA acetyltransferase n=1 Tax=Actinoalloteichus fjordicus TaxID=1612552 RepID=A0AAC9L967_9PSEU|nr:acyl-CoA thioesterase/bile acid-CoA:amino acid N-acyltransferase family protein [Actinoalloteichus fjordicus]APU13683.1 acyl-CoA thioester hydrolase/bile acid-CoA acetyltransferase [Actinoalloteichus fjordicus]